MYCFKREPTNDRKIWISQYCPKDFVQDCSSIWWIFHLVYEFHTEQAYSSWGHTRVVYALDLTSMEQSGNTLLRRPTVLLALLLIIIITMLVPIQIMSYSYSNIFGGGLFSNNNAFMG